MINAKDIVLAPTRVTSKTATCLDLFAIPEHISCISYKVGCISASDHLPVEVQIEGLCNKLTPVYKRSFKPSTWPIIRHKVESLNQYIPEEASTDGLLYTWHNSLQTILDEVAPIVRASRKQSRCPWMTPSIKGMIFDRDALAKKIRKGDSTDITLVKF